MTERVNVQVLHYEGHTVRTFKYDGEQWLVIRDAEAILGSMREVLRLKMKKDPRVRRVYVEVIESANCQVANCQLAIGTLESITGYVEQECSYGPYSLACVNGFGLVSVVKTRRKENFKEFARCVFAANFNDVPADKQRIVPPHERDEVRYELHIVQGTQRVILPIDSKAVSRVLMQ